MHKGMFLKVLSVAAMAMLLAGPSYAQGDSRFSGTVLDQTGAFVPGAGKKFVRPKASTADTQNWMMVPAVCPWIVAK